MFHWWDVYPWGWGMMLFMAILWIGLLVVLVLVIKWAYDRYAQERPLGPRPAESAMDILQKRFARGEVGAEEYREMKRELEGGQES